MTSCPKIPEALFSVSSATVSTVLLKKGLRNVWIRGTSHFRRVSRG